MSVQLNSTTQKIIENLQVTANSTKDVNQQESVFSADNNSNLTETLDVYSAHGDGKKRIAIIDDFDSGHGLHILEEILKTNPNAEVVKFDLDLEKGDIYKQSTDFLKTIEEDGTFDVVNLSGGSEARIAFFAEGMGVELNQDNLFKNSNNITEWIKTNDDASIADLIDQIESMDTSVVASAGNGGSERLNVINLAENAISVGSLDENGDKASYSANNSLIDEYIYDEENGTSIAAAKITADLLENYEPDVIAANAKYDESTLAGKAAQMGMDYRQSIENGTFDSEKNSPYILKNENGFLDIQSGLAFNTEALMAKDENKDGQVSAEEIGPAAELIDQNKDGIISAGEFLSVQMIKDKNKDGIISKEELNGYIDSDQFLLSVKDLYDIQIKNLESTFKMPEKVKNITEYKIANDIQGDPIDQDVIDDDITVNIGDDDDTPDTSVNNIEDNSSIKSLFNLIFDSQNNFFEKINNMIKTFFTMMFMMMFFNNKK